MARSSHILSLLATRNYPTMQMRFICRALTDYVSGDVLDIRWCAPRAYRESPAHVHSYNRRQPKALPARNPEAVNLRVPTHELSALLRPFRGPNSTRVICCFALETNQKRLSAHSRNPTGIASGRKADRHHPEPENLLRKQSVQLPRIHRRRVEKPHILHITIERGPRDLRKPTYRPLP